MIKFIKKYKWFILLCILAYLAFSFWLFVATGAPQDVPFEYQIF